jgi:hypothetical protein
MRWIPRDQVVEVYAAGIARHNYAGADLRLVCVEQAGALSVVAGCCTLVGELAPGEPYAHRYSRLIFYRAWVQQATVQELVAVMLSGQPTPIDLPLLGPVTGAGHWAQGAHLGSGERYTHTTVAWPSAVLLSRLTIADKLRDDLRTFPQSTEQFHAPGAPLYPDRPTAMAHHLYGLDQAQPAVEYGDVLTVVLPDERARIVEAKLDATSVTIRVERKLLPPAAELAVRIYAVSSAGTQHGLVPIVGDGAAFDASGTIARLLVHLVVPPDEILDELQFGIGFGRAPDPRLGRSPGSVRLEIEAAIAGGEGLTTEFKESISAKEDGRKLVETVAAFANGQGGLLLIGVADDASVVGHRVEHETEELRSLQQMIADRCDPRPDIRIERVDLGDATVTVVRVARGADPPYMVNSRFCVRHGANTVPGTRAELSHLASPRGADPDTLAGRSEGLY